MLKPNSSQAITVRTPAKLILSGEYAVVYGSPALAMAINRYVQVKINPFASLRSSAAQILFDFPDLGFNEIVDLSRLKKLKEYAESNYQRFLTQDCDIFTVLGEERAPALLQYAVIFWLDHYQLPLPANIHIQLTSTVPVGSGMGSSAASVVALMVGLASWFGVLEQRRAELYHLARSVENLQHGRSSGIDVQLALQGGCIRFQNGKSLSRPIVKLPNYLSLQLINTGKPISSTGECVSATAHYFKTSSTLIEDFAKVTEAFDQAWLQNDHANLLACIRDNHRLLVKIGAVPEQIQEFIALIEAMGGAGKISGAGSVCGQAGGIVIVLATQDITFLAERFGYTRMDVSGEAEGTHLIQQEEELSCGN